MQTLRADAFRVLFIMSLALIVASAVELAWGSAVGNCSTNATHFFRLYLLMNTCCITLYAKLRKACFSLNPSFASNSFRTVSLTRSSMSASCLQYMYAIFLSHGNCLIISLSKSMCHLLALDAAHVPHPYSFLPHCVD